MIALQPIRRLGKSFAGMGSRNCDMYKIWRVALYVILDYDDWLKFNINNMSRSIKFPGWFQFYSWTLWCQLWPISELDFYFLLYSSCRSVSYMSFSVHITFGDNKLISDYMLYFLYFNINEYCNILLFQISFGL